MLRKFSVGAVVGAAAISLTAAPSAAAAPAPATAPRPALATTLYYDATQAGEFKTAVAEGVKVWNTHVKNVQLVEAPQGRRAEIQIVADPGWPRATLGPVRPGQRVTVWFGRQAVTQGYNTTRIASHELGHSLGLPDAKPGPCSSLMSGSTGGVSCANPNPNATEAARVEANYRGVGTPRGPLEGRVLVDAP
ncbi:snapalysin [Actinomadura pelletieri DSM 43383]|uniref:Extracellular small neutral protease n=1 Tax=Actinomadura pelletieri DSM 43383 TaxID=1120940 RepID=A0A495QTB5_9ACTN|nr:snapalysin family zinc-dependent metalloprotease [Actinomadura pelletieri]RKS76657.1 snapalysin [Actinomadura pelletieri DSM 43383]